MKIVIILLMIIGIVNGATIEVKQNMKALYRGIELTEVQEDYILDNQDANIEIINKVLKIEAKQLKTKDFIHEKNVIEFVFNPDGTISKIKFLEKSNDRKIDKITKQIIQQASSKFNKPIEPTLMRFIFVYEIGKTTYAEINTNQRNEENEYQEIFNGTTRFEYSNKEYVRTFKTNKDGFVNIKASQSYCMKYINLLTKEGRVIITAPAHNLDINREIPKGEYKLLFVVKTACDINLLYP